MGLRALTVWAGVAVMTSVALGQPRDPKADRDLAEALRSEAASAVDALAAGGTFEEAQARTQRAMDAAIAHAPLTDLGLFRDLALAHRQTMQVAGATRASSQKLLGILRRNPDLGGALGFLIGPEDDLARVFSVLESLADSRGVEPVVKLSSISAALCVVHDAPSSHPAHGQIAPNPLEIFDHFAAHQGRMIFNLQSLPPELAVYLVDVAVPMNELKWAFDRYTGDSMIGRHYHDVPYDTEHFKRGAPKKILEHGYTLPNLLVYGGICGDQAFFAESIAKAVGAPSATVSGRGGAIGHAWVGFLTKAGEGRYRWNFKEGCYDDYEDVRGAITDPRSRQRVTDGDLVLLAEFANLPRERREAAIALADAAARLGEIRRANVEFPPKGIPGVAATHVRERGVEAELELLEAAVKAVPACRPAWMVLRELAEADALSLDQKRHWSEALMRVSGDDSPDFVAAMMRGMIASVDDLEEQSRLWQWSAKQFRSRPDLTAQMRMSEGAMWEQAERPTEAWKCYQEVVNRHINDTPEAVSALEACERLLRVEKRENQILPLWGGAWKKVRYPGVVNEFSRAGTNWHRIGTAYAARLREAGKTRDADGVIAQLAGGDRK